MKLVELIELILACRLKLSFIIILEIKDHLAAIDTLEFGVHIGDVCRAMTAETTETLGQQLSCIDIGITQLANAHHADDQHTTLQQCITNIEPKEQQSHMGRHFAANQRIRDDQITADYFPEVHQEKII